MSKTMLNINNRWDDISFVYKEPSQEYIRSEIQKLFAIVESYCVAANIDIERIQCNYATLKDIILRLDMRLLYFRVYHDRMQINEYKLICGLTVFWIIKLRPFWISINEEDDANFINLATNINEQISLHIVMMLLKEYNPDFFKNGKNLVARYCKELLYSFRFRDLSKESLFLMFDPFYYLSIFDSSIDSEGRRQI